MLVVGGIGRSKGVAFSPSMGFPAVASEHTTNGRIGTLHSAVHSLSGCDTSAIEGARNRTALPGPSCSSAIRSDINVLPVPQARLVVSSRDVSCGFEVRIGERIGVLLREDGGWRSGLCSQLDADVLLRAAAPLPTPSCRGMRVFPGESAPRNDPPHHLLRRIGRALSGRIRSEPRVRQPTPSSTALPVPGNQGTHPPLPRLAARCSLSQRRGRPIP